MERPSYENDFVVNPDWDNYGENSTKQVKPKKNIKKNKKKKKTDSELAQELCSGLRKLWATRQTEEIDKEKNPDKFVKITLRELFIYIFFLIILGLISFGMVSSTIYNFSNIMKSSFVTGPTESQPYITFSSITQLSDIWRFLQDIFPNNFYQSNFYTTANLSGTQPDMKNYVINENRVLGLSRLRQLRVMSNSCSIPDDFKQEIKTCYADWATGTEDKSPYGPYVYFNITNNSAWYYQSESKLGGSTYKGLMNSYGGGGFVSLLSSDPDQTNAIIQDLFNNLWIDRGTRAVFIDFTVYNANVNLFCQVKLVFELPATGGVVPSFTIRPVKLIRYVTVFDYFILICEIIFVGFLIYYTVEEVLEITKNGCMYFCSIWSILDVVILIIGYICSVFDIYRTVKVNSILDSLLQNDNQYIDFEFLCYWQTQFNNAIAGMVFIAWIKIFKYTSFNKTMTQLSLTLSHCAKDVSGFAIMFFIVFLAYAQLGYLVFGTQVSDFSTFQNSIYTLFRIVLGDFDFEALEAANRVLGPIFFLTYVFFVFFVLLNMFIAIINDTYGEIKSDLANQKSEIELASFFKKGYNRVLDKLNIKRTQIVDIQKAITQSDLNKDNKIDFIEWRNNLRAKGYPDIEIETLFAKYDVDGDKVLNQEEQKNMLKDLSLENDELKQAYMLLEKAKEEEQVDEESQKKRLEGVATEDYTLLSNRIDKMESSIGAIMNKVDSVLNKIDEKEKKKQDTTRSPTQIGQSPSGRIGTATTRAGSGKDGWSRNDSAVSRKNFGVNQSNC